MERILDQQANTIEAVLAAHGLDVQVAGGTLSPRLIHFTLALPPGLRLGGLTPALPDLADGLGVDAVRLAPAVDSGAPTLEVPRPDPVPVRLLPLARSVAAIAPPCTATLGRDVSGAPLLLRLDAPEVGPVLISGAAEAGKSALLRSMALSLALHNGPDTLRLLLVDLSGAGRRGARGGTWADLTGLPHLVGEVVREPAEARLRLRWAARLASGRAALAAAGEPIEGANLVVLIDGLDAALTGRDGAELAEVVQTIAGGRDLGVQLVAAGHDAALSDLLDWGARVVGRVPSAESAAQAAGVRGTGAEGLLGKGDFLAVLGGEVIRMQAGFAGGEEIRRTVALLAECVDDELAAAVGGGRAGWNAPRAMPPAGAANSGHQGRGTVRLVKSGS